MKAFKGEIILFITSLIWGLAFIFQSTASAYLGSFTFNGLRFILGALSLVPLLRFNRHGIDLKKCLKLGIILGIFIGIAANFQQYAISFTSAGKAGFMTSLYMVIVPLIGFIFFKDKISKYVIIAIIVAVFGMYFLCGENFSFAPSDIYLIVCALFFALQIVFIDRFARDVNSVLLSFFEYLTAGLMSLVIALFFEDININNIFNAASSILYTGVLSTGVAYTLQIIGQKYTEASIASIIMSLESVIAAIAGFIILKQSLSSGEIIGCILMFIAVLLAQLRIKEKESERSE